MKEFIENLYASASFPIYLAVAIIVLLIAFVVVFFLGKKDQKKLEETQRLEAINANAFAQMNNQMPLEAPVNQMPMEQNMNYTEQMPQENLYTEPALEQPMMQPNIPEAPVLNTEVPVMDTMNMDVNNQMVNPVNYETPVYDVPVMDNSYVAPMDANMPVNNMYDNNVNMMPDAMMYQAPVTPEQNFEVYKSPVLDAPVQAPVQNPINWTPVEESLDESLVIPTTDVPMQQTFEQPVAPLYEAPVVENNLTTPETVENFNVPAENYNDILSSIESELNKLEKVKEVNAPVYPAPVMPSMPDETLNVNSAPSQPTTINNVFSSVYVPNKPQVEPNNEDTMKIELPKLKNGPVLEEEKQDKLHF